MPSATVDALVTFDTGTGTTLAPSVPLPSPPAMSLPQHLTEPSLSRAQLTLVPAAIAATPLRPFTNTGMLLPVLVLSPSSPDPLLPQHFTVSSASKAQVCVAPVEMVWAVLRS